MAEISCRLRLWWLWTLAESSCPQRLGGHPLATMRRFGESQAAPTDAPKPATPEVGNCLENGVMPFGITGRQETGTGHGHPGLGGTSGPARHGWARRIMEGLALSHDGRESVVRRTVVAMVLAALVCVSCTSTPATSPKSTGSSSTTTTISSTTTSSRPPSALDNLTTYFAAAEGVDRRLKAAAIVVNGDIGATQLTVDQSTTDAISTADPTAAGHAIPAGITPDLLLPVMRVQSDLMSRFYALRGFERANLGTGGTVVPLSDQSAQEAMSCLGNGTQAAASFSADLAAARAVAAKAPPVTVAAPDSRAAADLAVLLRNLVGRNSGCMSCGGERETSLPTITWYATRMPAGFHGHPAPVDGNINGIDFLANYTLGTGWDIQAYAC